MIRVIYVKRILILSILAFLFLPTFVLSQKSVEDITFSMLRMEGIYTELHSAEKMLRDTGNYYHSIGDEENAERHYALADLALQGMEKIKEMKTLVNENIDNLENISEEFFGMVREVENVVETINEELNTTCVDECEGGSKECFEDGYRICDNYDIDSCLEWGPVIPCSRGEICENGECVEISRNRKNMSKYSDKEVFLISDRDWRDVLQLVPVTTWTEGGKIRKYPTLIFHVEKTHAPLLTVECTHKYFKTFNTDSWQSFVAEDNFIHKIKVVGVSKDRTFSLRLMDKNGVLIKESDPITTDNWWGARYFILDIPVTKGEIYRIGFSVSDQFAFCGDDPYPEGEFSGDADYDLEMKTYGGDVIDSFDADSIIYFMQQYSPDKVTIIGSTPQELDNLLVADPELGAGLSINQIKRIRLMIISHIGKNLILLFTLKIIMNWLSLLPYTLL